MVFLVDLCVVFFFFFTLNILPDPRTVMVCLINYLLLAVSTVPSSDSEAIEHVTSRNVH